MANTTLYPSYLFAAKQHKIQNDTAGVETSVAKVRRQHAFLSADINGNPQITKVWLAKETQQPGLYYLFIYVYASQAHFSSLSCVNLANLWPYFKLDGSQKGQSSMQKNGKNEDNN